MRKARHRSRWRQSPTAMHRALLLGETEVTTSNMSDNEDQEPSLVRIAVAQWLAWLSIQFPFLSQNRRMAMLLILLIPLLPFVGSIVCVCFGQLIVGGILATLFFAIVSYALYQASSNTRYPRTEQDLRSSLRTLQFRFGQVRAKRCKEYDLYLPPGTRDTIKCALLFIPNEKVDHLAYAGVASQLSDQGILVVVQNTEPYRLPSTLVGSGQEELDAIKQHVEREYQISQWAIGGHGMGSIPAARYVGKQLNMPKLVIWGAFPFNVDLSNSKVNVLVVIGSKDGYWTCRSEKDTEKFKSLLPKENCVLKMVPGGNHAGFAHYGPIPQDGERDIRVEEQQKTAATLTALFLKNAPSSYVPPAETA